MSCSTVVCWTLKKKPTAFSLLGITPKVCHQRYLFCLLLVAWSACPFKGLLGLIRLLALLFVRLLWLCWNEIICEGREQSWVVSNLTFKVLSLLHAGEEISAQAWTKEETLCDTIKRCLLKIEWKSQIYASSINQALFLQPWNCSLCTASASSLQRWSPAVAAPHGCAGSASKVGASGRCLSYSTEPRLEHKLPRVRVGTGCHFHRVTWSIGWLMGVLPAAPSCEAELAPHR